MSKTSFLKIFSETHRRGIDNIIAQLEAMGFLEAPTSSRFHLACKGGLAEHSMNVYETVIMLREQIIHMKPELEAQLSLESVAIFAMLHGVCKIDIYKEGILSRKSIILLGIISNSQGSSELQICFILFIIT